MRIGIVNDLPIAVEALRRALGHRSELHVVWVASSGEEAVEACKRDLPDLLLMDLVMPGISGAEATRQIMRDTPCPILLVTTSIEANVSQVFEAMGYGALDAVPAPAPDHPGGKLQSRRLLDKIASIGKLVGMDNARRHAQADRAQRCTRLVAIGASAGGPVALARLLKDMPADLPAAVVVVQHVDPQFVPGMIDWLRGQTSLILQEAADDDELKPGTVYMASTGDHLTLKPNGRLGYTAEPRDYVYRPSVDVFFASVARYFTGDAVGVLLTGMGRDGAEGLKMLRDQGRVTIAQDQASSAVYGMPKAAAAIGAASEIIGLDRIARRLIALMDSGMERTGGK